ncbi:MAG TPA: hypothetical protein IAC02_06225 [Candidatus Coprovivens excrementavium]|nr:hypothetical protein [Candidatus Coprovivens excrementavium]
MEVKLFGVDIVKLYNYNLDKAYNFVKDNTDYLIDVPIEEVKNINFSAYKDIIILLRDGTVILNGNKCLTNIKTLAFISGLSIFAISNDHVITSLTGEDGLYNFINNDNYKYRKIIVTPLVIVALTHEKDIRLFGTLCDRVVDYQLYFNVDDIGYVEENDDIVIIKDGKVFSLFHEHDYSNEKPDVLVEGPLDDLEIIGE